MFALFGTTILKVAFGLGISTDVNNVRNDRPDLVEEAPPLPEER